MKPQRNFKSKKSNHRKRKITSIKEEENPFQSSFHEIENDQNEIEQESSQNQAEEIFDHDNPDAIKNVVKTKDRIFGPKRFKNLTNQTKRLIIILERANLEVVKTRDKFELLNTDDHLNLIHKYKKNPMYCRPDIVHQSLLMLLDSPLNRAGLLQVFIHTDRNVLIEINPQTRIPRTFKRFAFLFVQLLHKLSIRASETSDKLLRVIKNPITDHLPVGCRKIGTSFKCPKLVAPRDLVPNDGPLTIVIGAMAHGKVEVDYTEYDVAISQYPLSAALTCTKICSAFEEAWNIC
ncbi:Ribosomal RNA small subunit methyltransferase NEP1 [Sarcoptes scabiei]|uniref:18S rRNA (pseudouridine-N1)-methyltransferase n=1 Tax=Sarcoptes scabiei TaxID=52283 RepID=A0A131ZX66_SARSC|nr:Ribosomal RNA small subunit methyltransferase NEP1 [Sarcoptes scabiei]KPM03442.1 ribosomal RNA small subunit methyltransferase NEP1-like protein [Sarcoptes scabiei]UXI21403.1 Down syndrome cell adhesion molecule-like protein 1 [Sarcoptes scabiei]